MNTEQDEFDGAIKAHSRLVIFIGCIFLLLMGRFFYVQILHGKNFQKKARASLIGAERIPARRGIIRDTRGKVVASNEPHYWIELRPDKLRGDKGKEVIGLLANLLHLREDERLGLEERVQNARKKKGVTPPVVLDRNLVDGFCPDDPAVPLEPLKVKVPPLLNCRLCGNEFSPASSEKIVCDCKSKQTVTIKEGEKSAECCGKIYVNTPVCPNDGHLLESVERNLRCPVDGQHYVNEVAVLKSHAHLLPGVSVKTGLRRHYAFPFLASHTLGYMNRVTAEEYRAEKSVYGLSDMVGRRGLEHALEARLRGVPGKVRFLRNSTGSGPSSENEVTYQAPVHGENLKLTLDVRMQREVEKAFRYYESGGAVVIHPKTGAIIAIYSKPGFDSNVWTGRLTTAEWERANKNPYSPMIHKARTAYHPGSVYKIVTAAAGLDLGLITAESPMYCQGHYDFAKRRFHCHNRSGHGTVNLKEALKHSCDVYFYKLGEMLGMKRLAEYGYLFGFGDTTGVEITDQRGIVPTKEYHATKTKVGWQPGFTLSTAIGQGALTATPLQIARSFAAVINGGNVLDLHLVDEYTDPKGKLIERHGVKVDSTLNLSEEHMAIIREGLLAVVNEPDGTAAESRLENIVIAGKTGTAESAEWRAGASAKLGAWLREDHAWFAAYAPADDPQVVVVVFVEHGGSGSKRAAPIAVNIIRSWVSLGIYKAPPAEEGGESP
jgi:penicillin-binding protein 2